MMWLTHVQRPHYKTLANFRKDNAEAFQQVFRMFVATLKEWDLLEGQTIAVDSFKIRAQNSLKNNYNARKVERHLDYIDRKIAEYEQRLDDGDHDPHITSRLDAQQAKRSEYEAIQHRLEASDDGQLSTTDPDARAGVFQRNSVRVGYNIQAVSDSKHKLLIAVDTGQVNATRALSGMIRRAQHNLGHDTMDVLADKGYHSGRELQTCAELGVTTYVAPKASSSSKRNVAFANHRFTYCPQTDTYHCPAGATMHTTGTWHAKRPDRIRAAYRIKQYKTRACKSCDLQVECTKSRHGRVIERSEYAEYIEQNRARVRQHKQYYRQRQQIIEHQFGTLKRDQHLDYTLMRGKRHVLSEVYIAFTMYNLRRSLSILGATELLKRLKALFSAKLWLGRLLVHDITHLQFIHSSVCGDRRIGFHENWRDIAHTHVSCNPHAVNKAFNRILAKPTIFFALALAFVLIMTPVGLYGLHQTGGGGLGGAIILATCLVVFCLIVADRLLVRFVDFKTLNTIEIALLILGAILLILA